MKGTPKQSVSVVNRGKSPKQSENPNASNHERPAWLFASYSHGGRWSFDEATFFHDIIPHLKSRESQTWDEITLQSGGKKEGHGTNSHFVPRSSLIKEAQDIISKIYLDDYDAFFSLRLTGKSRIWGVRDGRALRIIWYDPEHEICPSHR